MKDSRRAEALRKLLRARAGLVSVRAGGTDCVRLCAGAGDGVPGVLVDRFGALVVAVDYAEPAGDDVAARTLLHLVQDCFPRLAAVAKVRASVDGTNKFVTATFNPADGAPPDMRPNEQPSTQPDTRPNGQPNPFSEAPPRSSPILATERGLKFEIGVDPTHDFGIFLDAAKARLFVRENAKQRRVLNLFSYAGAFGIAAAAGGAADVTNVDPNRDYLAWSLRNATLNDVRMRVLPDTAQDYLGKHLRRLTRNPAQAGHDFVIVDPPAFGVGRGNERVLRLLWPELFARLRAMNAAVLVLMCNDKSFRSRQSFATLVAAELGALYRIERLGTHLSAEELDAERPPLGWTAGVEDPHYVEPVVLACTRLDSSRAK